VLLTRAPLYSWYCYHFLVRLACVRHAASVDSEPGSNSRLKPDCFPSSTEVDSVQRHRTLENVRCNLVRMIKPNLIFSHDWHVQPNCQRSLRAIHLSGALLGSRPRLLRRGVLELVALAEVMHLCRLRRFCANLLKLSKFNLHVKLNLSIGREESSLASGDSNSAKYQTTTSKVCPSR
jgi:hypothetical protein